MVHPAHRIQWQSLACRPQWSAWASSLFRRACRHGGHVHPQYVLVHVASGIVTSAHWFPFFSR